MSNSSSDHHDGLIPIHDHIPMPEELWSFETGKPMLNCVECGRDLSPDGTPYLIEKARHGTEVIAEFAWCFECHDTTQESYSKESRTRIWDYFLDRVSFEDRRRRLSQDHRCDLAAWTSACITCGKPAAECKETLTLAQADGGDLMFHYLPYLICGECCEAIVDLMSNPSLDAWHDWLQQNLPMAPEAQALPRSRSRNLLLI